MIHKLLAIAGLLGCCICKAFVLVEVGLMPNQVLPAPDGKIVTINSGFISASRSKPSVTIFDPVTLMSKHVSLPPNTNAYRGDFDEQNLLVSLNTTDQLISLGLVPGEATPKFIFNPSDQDPTGAESVLVFKNEIWLSFISLSYQPGGRPQFGPGLIFVFEKASPHRVIRRIVFEAFNPNFLFKISDNRVGVSLGTYGAIPDSGKIVVLSPEEFPEQSVIHIRNTGDQSFAKIFGVTGTPGFQSQDGEDLLVCDLEKPQFYRIDLVSDRVQEIPLPLSSCASIHRWQNQLWVTNLSGGLPGQDPAHLFLFEDLSTEGQTLKPSCKIEFSDPASPGPLAAMPSSAYLDQARGVLYIALSGANKLAIVNLKDRLFCQ